MPLRLDIKRKLLARSDRVKCVDLHPNEPWTLVSLYNGNVHIWNYETQQLLKSLEVSELPVRAGKFIVRKSWIVTGSDDLIIRIFNYNTLERVHQFEAHADYIRSIIVHPTKPFIISSSDDLLIKVWDWENKWQLKQTFEGHTYYVMQLAINPKDNVTFASASLDKTIKVWQFGSQTSNFTLEGHEKGVNCVDYYHGGDKPYIISGADDKLVKIWDYQNKTCVATLDGHANNITSVCFHPELPMIITGAEDGSVRMWHSNTFRLESTLNYGLERVWCISTLKGNNTIAIGYDEGSVTVKMGREEPAVSMDSSGKILWAKHAEVQQANLKTIDPDVINNVGDGEKIIVAVKDMGTSDIYPQTLQHSANGRYVVACGDGEYIIYTATALRNKAYGSGIEFAWCNDSNIYAVRDSSNNIKIFKNFKDHTNIKTETTIEGIDDGPLLGVRSSSDLCFYDFETGILIRRIEIEATKVYWSGSAEYVTVATADSFYILKYDSSVVENASKDEITEDGIEDAFDVIGEFNEIAVTGFWVGDCFVYTTNTNRLNYIVGSEVITIGHMDKTFYLLGYIPKDNRIYACDKDLNIVSFKLLLSVLEYQAAILRRDKAKAIEIMETIPNDQKTRIAHFLQKQGLLKVALEITQDADHKFDLAIKLGDLNRAFDIAKEIDSKQKWDLLAQAATEKSELILAAECLGRAKDFGGLYMLAVVVGSPSLMANLAKSADAFARHNTSFLANFTLGNINECLEKLISLGRLPEAAMFAHTYCPSQVDRVVGLWKGKIENSGATTRQKNIAEQIANPSAYENLFPGFSESLQAEAEIEAEKDD